MSRYGCARNVVSPITARPDSFTSTAGVHRRSELVMMGEVVTLGAGVLEEVGHGVSPLSRLPSCTVAHPDSNARPEWGFGLLPPRCTPASAVRLAKGSVGEHAGGTGIERRERPDRLHHSHRLPMTTTDTQARTVSHSGGTPTFSDDHVRFRGREAADTAAQRPWTYPRTGPTLSPTYSGLPHRMTGWAMNTGAGRPGG